MNRARGVCCVALLVVAAQLLGAQAAAEAQHRPITTDAAKAAVGGKAVLSQCAKDCIAKAKELGFEKVANSSMACFMPYRGKQLSTADCCDKAELLLGRHGSLANCMCCPEFARELLQAVPLERYDTTHDEYLEKLNLCRVPLVGTEACSPRVAKERAPLQPGSNGPYFETLKFDRPIVQQLNLTGMYPWIGFYEKFTATKLANRGKAAVRKGQVEQLKVVGASDFFNDYITGYMLLIDQEVGRYPAPTRPKLPPLPEQYKADVAWVANLRRGPYPDLVFNRPERFSPKATDPLQNGQIADMSPGVVFAGRVAALNQAKP